MSETELFSAMRIGSQNPLDKRDVDDLGRFGLGLKTASFSQCRRLTVVTRQAGETSSAVWDLDYVAKTDEWLVQIPENPDALPWVDKLGEQGTLLIWEDLDRLVEETETGIDVSRFVAQVDEAREAGKRSPNLERLCSEILTVTNVVPPEAN
jgi:hypothetical protein